MNKNTTDVLAMVKEFLVLENMENNFALDGLEDKAQTANTKKWSIKKLAREYGVEKEFSALLKDARNKQ